jgi:hypothetical protein
MATPANLDAFIPRDDFFAASPERSQYGEPIEFGMLDLEVNIGKLLRKPDFQRETAAWDPKRIAQFIKSFAEEELIPAVIFWSSPTTGNIYVVDGAHRLSALLAWLYDDYGDKKRSQEYFDFRPSLDQLEAADEARRLVNQYVGPYREIIEATKEKNSLQKFIDLEPHVSRRRIPIQWLKAANAQKAEDSFFRINLQSVSLDKTEQLLIKSRKLALAVSTRGIVRGGAGHKYWDKFPEPTRTKIVTYAKDIHDILFLPPLDPPVRTLELPIAGQPYGGNGMRLTMELVQFANTKSGKASAMPDEDGTKTLGALQRTWSVAVRMCGSDAASLGLHPVVYVYSHATGKHLPSAFMALARWITDLDSRKNLSQFCAMRKDFEEFLVGNEAISREIVSQQGSRGRAVPTLIAYYQFLFDRLSEGLSKDEIEFALSGDQKLKGFLAISKAELQLEHGVDFSPEVKSQGFIKEALGGSIRCVICEARLYPSRFNSEHKKDKKLGGIGSPENHGLAHYYCNSNKEQILAAKAEYKSAMVRGGNLI